MPSKLTTAKSPVGNFGFSLTNPRSALSATVQAALGFTFLIVVAGFAWNQGAPVVSSLIRNLSGGRIDAGRPGSQEGQGIEVV